MRMFVFPQAGNLTDSFTGQLDLSPHQIMHSEIQKKAETQAGACACTQDDGSKYRLVCRL